MISTVRKQKLAKHPGHVPKGSLVSVHFFIMMSLIIWIIKKSYKIFITIWSWDRQHMHETQGWNSKTSQKKIMKRSNLKKRRWSFTGMCYWRHSLGKVSTENNQLTNTFQKRIQGLHAEYEWMQSLKRSGIMVGKLILL